LVSTLLEILDMELVVIGMENSKIIVSTLLEILADAAKHDGTQNGVLKFQPFLRF
jgi:hypothetical protein